jgi:NADH-quinone oxidoreductase subunit F
VPEGRTLKAVIPGGSSAPVLPAAIMNELTMDYDAIAKAGSMLGSGAVIVMDDSRSMVHSLLRLSYFYMHESCGQCTPCRGGTGWLYRMVERIANGQGRMQDIDLLNSVSDNIQGRTICALGDAAAMPVRAMIKHFKDEFVALIEKNTAPVHAGRIGPADSPNPALTAAARTLQYGMATRDAASPEFKQLVKP